MNIASNPGVGGVGVGVGVGLGVTGGIVGVGVTSGVGVGVSVGVGVGVGVTAGAPGYEVGSFGSVPASISSTSLTPSSSESRGAALPPLRADLVVNDQE